MPKKLKNNLLPQAHTLITSIVECIIRFIIAMQMKKQVSAPAQRSTAMAFAVDIPADKDTHYSGQHKNIRIVQWNGGLQAALHALASETADQYVLALHSDTAKLNAWLQQVRESEAELVVGEATATQNKRTEWLGGFRAAEVQAPWILLRGDNWKRAAFDQVHDAYSLLYVLEKQGLARIISAPKSRRPLPGRQVMPCRQNSAPLCAGTIPFETCAAPACAGRDYSSCSPLPSYLLCPL